jgi:hypothetical protein
VNGAVEANVDAPVVHDDLDHAIELHGLAIALTTAAARLGEIAASLRTR